MKPFGHALSCAVLGAAMLVAWPGTGLADDPPSAVPAPWVEWRTGLLPKSSLAVDDLAPPPAREFILDWFPLRGGLKLTLGATLDTRATGLDLGDVIRGGILEPGLWIERLAYRFGFGYAGRRQGRRLRLRYDFGLLLQTAPLTGEGLVMESPDVLDSHGFLSPLRDETGQPILYPVVLLGIALEF